MVEQKLLRILREQVPEQVVRELARTPSYRVLKRVVEGRAVSRLDTDDVLNMLRDVQFVESSMLRVRLPRRFTKAFWKRLGSFYYQATLHARTGIFLLETGSPITRHAFNRLLLFTESFARAYLQGAEYFAGLGQVITPRLADTAVFHVITGYPAESGFCHACSIRIGKYVHEGSIYCTACYEKKRREKKRRRA